MGVEVTKMEKNFKLRNKILDLMDRNLEIIQNNYKISEENNFYNFFKKFKKWKALHINPVIREFKMHFIISFFVIYILFIYWYVFFSM